MVPKQRLTGRRTNKQRPQIYVWNLQRKSLKKRLKASDKWHYILKKKNLENFQEKFHENNERINHFFVVMFVHIWWLDNFDTVSWE